MHFCNSETHLSLPVLTADDAAYVLAVEFLPAVGCVSKRVQLWHWLYSKVHTHKHTQSVCTTQLCAHTQHR